MRGIKRIRIDETKSEKKIIDKIIINYSFKDIEEKLELLQIKRNIVNPAGWFINAMKANYINPESYKEENDEEKEIIEAEEVETESKIVKSDKITPKKEKEENKKLSREEELKRIKQIRNNISK